MAQLLLADAEKMKTDLKTRLLLTQQSCCERFRLLGLF